MKYVMVYYGGSMPQSPDEQAAVLKAWGAWYTELSTAVVDMGNPFTPAVKTIAPGGTVTSGPIGERATGYSIIEADSLDSAVEKAKTCPVLQGGARIAVYETFNVV